MRLKCFFSALLFVFLLNCANISVSAFSQENINIMSSDSVIVVADLASDTSILANYSTRATNRFDWSISPNITKKASTSFSLDANETVTFNCTYTPSSASVDFGLISSDGTFYYANSTNGKMKSTVKVPKTDKYYLAIRNNASATVQVTGSVSY